MGTGVGSFYIEEMEVRRYVFLVGLQLREEQRLRGMFGGRALAPPVL